MDLSNLLTDNVTGHIAPQSFGAEPSTGYASTNYGFPSQLAAPQSSFGAPSLTGSQPLTMGGRLGNRATDFAASAPASFMADKENFLEGGARGKRPRVDSTSFNFSDSNHSFQYTPPSVPESIPVECAKALADQAHLSDDRRRMLLSFHRACAKLEKADAMTRLMSYALQLEASQSVSQQNTLIQQVLQQLGLLTASANQSFTVSEDLRVQIRGATRMVLLEHDRRNFRDMFADVLVLLEAKAQELGISQALVNATSRRKIITAVKKGCNADREFLRRLIIASVLNAGPTRTTLAEFCARVVDKLGRDTAIPVTAELTGQLALMRAYALEVQDKLNSADSDLIDDDDAEDDDDDATENGPADPKKKASTKKDDLATKFWLGCEKFMTKKLSSARGSSSKAAQAEVIRKIIEADNRRFASSATPGASSSTTPTTSPLASHPTFSSELVDQYLG